MINTYVPRASRPSEQQPHCEEVKIVASKDQYLWDSQHTKYLDLAGSAALG